MKKRSTISTVILILVFLIGLSVMLYPTVSDFLNSISQSRYISGYKNEVAELNQDEYDSILEQARSYNTALLGNTARFEPTPEETLRYEQLLRVDEAGVMGYLEIPKIDVYLPMYHGVSESVLEVGIGHIEGSSLPIGGAGTHTLLSGHRGLPSAKIFTDLDKLEIGDSFSIKVLNETMTYEIEEIQTVLPSEVEALAIAPRRDLCTLVTCTPYGVNSHRLLITGVRVDTEIVPGEKTKLHVVADAVQIDPIYVAPVMGAPILILIVVYMLIRAGITRRGLAEKSRDKEESRKT